jgi:hypothetical protein
VRGVVAAAQHQAIDQVAHADPFARPHFQQRLAVFGVVGRRPHDLVERQLLHRHVGGHQLGRAGDQQPLLGRLREQDFAGAAVHHRPGLRVDAEFFRRGLRLRLLFPLRRPLAASLFAALLLGAWLSAGVLPGFGSPGGRGEQRTGKQRQQRDEQGPRRH